MGRRRQAGWLVGWVCLTLATAAVCWPDEPSATDLYAVIPRSLNPVRLHDEELAADLADSRSREKRIAVLLADLIAGRLTVPAAVRRHQEMCAAYPRMVESVQRAIARDFPAGTYEASVARYLVARCEQILGRESEPADAIQARRDAELAAFAASPSAGK